MVSLLLRILRSSCTKHEGNRINLVLMKGIEIVLKTAEKFKGMYVVRGFGILYGVVWFICNLLVVQYSSRETLWD